MIIWLDAGGPLLVAVFGGVVVAGVLAAVGAVFLGLWLVRRRRRKAQAHDPEAYS